MFPRVAAGVLAAALVAATASFPAAAAAEKFSVAVLRRDGLLIPFASFNGRVWSVPWPGGDPKAELPISLDDIPKRWWGDVSPTAPWTAWFADGETRPLKLMKPVHVPIFCGAHLAISTDYRGEAPTEREPTVPKDAVGVTGHVKIEPITQVSVNSPDAAALVEAITDKFNEEETLATNLFSRWWHPYGPLLRSRFPITLESFYRATERDAGGEFRTSYVEAVRRYPAGPNDEGCGLITYARAWITQVPGKKPNINLGARITYCDRADVSFLQPFGRVRLDTGRKTPDVYWIYQLSSWRDEFYSVARVSPDGMKPVVVVGGGGCPKDKDQDR